MILNITYGANVTNAPPGFKTAVAAVQQLFESTFTDPVTVNIQVDFGNLGHGLLGQSSYGLNTYSFSQITAAVRANSKSGDDVNAIASLPTTDPIPGTHHYVMTPAEAKALGLLGATTALDGTATFSSTAAFDSTAATASPPASTTSKAASRTNSRRSWAASSMPSATRSRPARRTATISTICSNSPAPAPTASSASPKVISRSTTAPPASTTSTTIRTTTSAIGRRARATTHFWPSAAPAW